jgi:hypothetical protein
MEKLKEPMVGDVITYLDCTDAARRKTCAEDYRQGIRTPNAECIRDHLTTGKCLAIDYSFEYVNVGKELELVKFDQIVQIRRDIIAEDKAQKFPDHIIPLDF